MAAELEMQVDRRQHQVHKGCNVSAVILNETRTKRQGADSDEDVSRQAWQGGVCLSLVSGIDAHDATKELHCLEAFLQKVLGPVLTMPGALRDAVCA